MAATAPTQSENVEKKTENPSNTPDEKFAKESKQGVVQSSESNLLNTYRSVTYNFSLGALDSGDLADPNRYRNSELKYLILKSGGKGGQGMTAGSQINVASVVPTAGGGRGSTEVYTDPRRSDISVEKASAPLRNIGNELIDGFNANSPGKFDMFIENIEIETTMSPGEDTNVSLATKIKFEVIEPFSVNGFIEALHVSALSAGYPSYLQASFLLKMEFWGYPDNTDLPEPEKVNDTERYFPIGLTGIEVDITEKGTRYRCTAVPYNERAFGQPNVIKKPIKMKGETVGDIFKNFFKSINEQAEDDAEKSKKDKNKRDMYAYRFEKWDPSAGFVDASLTSPMRLAKFTEILKDNALYSMNNPAKPGAKPNAYKTDGAAQPSTEQIMTDPEAIKYNPKDSAVNFPEGMAITDAVISVLRDSEYVKNIIKDIGKPGNPDEFGMLDYFLVRLEITNRTILDSQSQKPYQIYTYVIAPYKIHISRIPNYGHDRFPEETLKKLSLREYNYIYTGKNVDVLNFKLNFNTLFFEAVPAEMANKDTPGTKNSAVPSNSPELKVRTKSEMAVMGQSGSDQIPSSPTRVVPSKVQAETGGNASQPKDNPYSLLARNMHEAIVNSKASMLTGEIEILGDPFFLVTGGAGNFKTKPSSRGKTTNGEANQNYSEVLITVNFRNPIDYNSFEQGGMISFDKDRVPFSGVYRVLKVASNFKDGVFKQKLDILRVPGQVLNNAIPADDPKDVMITAPKPGSQVIPEEPREARAPEFRSYYDNNTTINDVNATGGLSDPSLSNSNDNNSIIGKPLPFDISSDIRLSASGLVELSENPAQYEESARILSASNILSNDEYNYPMINSIVDSSYSNNNEISNLGSGIGEGATVLVDASIPTSLTMSDIRQGLTINDSNVPSNNMSILNSISSVRNIPGNNNLIGSIGNKTTELQSLISDPNGIASKVRLDSSKISGLYGGGLLSKTSEKISDIVSSIPSNVNLRNAKAAGLALDMIPASKLSNIPATPPYSVAPAANSNMGYSKNIPTAAANPYSNLTGSFNPVDINSTRDKLATAKKYTNIPNIPDMGLLNSVTSKFGSNSSGQSPLDKLVSKSNISNSPPSDLDNFYG